jgi:hypothetical protein
MGVTYQFEIIENPTKVKMAFSRKFLSFRAAIGPGILHNQRKSKYGDRETSKHKPTNGSELLKSLVASAGASILTASSWNNEKEKQKIFLETVLDELVPPCPCHAGRFDKSVREAATDMRLTQRRNPFGVMCTTSSSRTVQGVDLGDELLPDVTRTAVELLNDVQLITSSERHRC